MFTEKKAVWWYGTPFVDINEDWVCVTTIVGAYDFIKAYGSENIEICYVDADTAIREERQLHRGGELDAEWERRKIADEQDFSKEKLQELIDFYGKEITVLHNNMKVTFGKMYPSISK